MTRNVKVNLDLSKLFDGVVFSDTPKDLEVEIKIEDSPESYKKLCTSEFIKTWNFVNEEIDEDFSVNNYTSVSKAFREYDINMKDLRDIIMISYSYFCVSQLNSPGTPKIKDVINYFLVNKDSIKDKVYSEEFITSTLNVLSGGLPLVEYLEKLEDTKKGNYTTFEEFYKKLFRYGTGE